MARDFRDLHISTGDRQAVENILRFQQALQDHDDEAERVIALAQTQPQVDLLQIYAAAMLMRQQSEDSVKEAITYLERVDPDRCNEREKLLHCAMRAWTKANGEATLQCLENLLDQWPEDLTSLKLAETVFLQFPNYRRQLFLMEKCAWHHTDCGYFLAMLGFACTLNGLHARSLQIIEQAWHYQPGLAWADHAALHACHHLGQFDQVREMVGQTYTGRQHHGIDARAHNSWHLALLDLHSRNDEPASSWYELEAKSLRADHAGRFADAAGFLWRCKLAGLQNLPRPGESLLKAAMNGIGQRICPLFNALCAYILALANELEPVEQAIKWFGQSSDSHPDPLWREVPDLLAFSIACAMGEHAKACEHLSKLHAGTERFGGCDLQNAVLVQAHIHALARSGQAAQARQYLQEMTNGRTPTPFERAIAGMG